MRGSWVEAIVWSDEVVLVHACGEYRLLGRVQFIIFLVKEREMNKAYNNKEISRFV